MGIYHKYVLPRAINIVCRHESVGSQREKVVPLAEGRVLEIGIGSGLNINYYDALKVSGLVGIDPSEELWGRRIVDLNQVQFGIEFIKAKAEGLPFEDGSFDTIVTTFTLCTVEDPLMALSEMKRVLKPGGKLLFCEHGLAPDRSVRSVQNIINPLWRPVAGGCNLNRDIPGLIEAGGFAFEELKSDYSTSRMRMASYNYCGVAVCRSKGDVGDVLA